MKNLSLGLAAALCCGAMAVNQANAAMQTFGFSNITGNDINDAMAGEAQLSVTISDEGVGAGQVAFIFTNVGPDSMSITDVYFDDGSLLGIASIINGSGVAFSQGASPGDLPGGNSVGFMATAGFTADSDPPAQPNGVNPGETLTIVFNLIAGQTYADVIAAMGIGFGEGGLVIGIHVQGFAGGGSEAFITDGPPDEMVPLPAGVALGLAGLAPVMIRRRRQSMLVSSPRIWR